MKNVTFVLFLMFLVAGIRAPVYGQLAIGEDAPDFTLKDIGGAEHSLSDYQGKAVLLVFLGANCPYCKDSAPYVESLIWQVYKESNLQILGIDQWDYTAAQLQTFFKDPTGVTYPLLQKGSDVSLAYKVSYDWFVLLNQEHKVSYVATGTLPTHNSGGTADAIVKALAAEVKSVIQGGVTDVEEEDSNTVPRAFELNQNYPNPFNPETTISFTLQKAANIKVSVFDVKGALVRTLAGAESRPGTYRLTWDGRSDAGNPVASGMYFYRLKAVSGREILYSQTKKMLLIK